MDDRPRGVQEVWEAFWARGIADPLMALEQMAFLVLLRYVDLVDARSSASATDEHFVSIFTGREHCRWAQLMAVSPERALEVIRRDVPVLLEQLADHSGIAPTLRELRLTLADPVLVRAAMKPLDNLGVGDVGPFYTELLEGLGRDGRTGPLRTPPAIARTIVRLARVRPGDVVVDPGAGMAQLLLEAHRTSSAARLIGWESDPRMAHVGAVNLFVHGVELPGIEIHGMPVSLFEPASVDAVVSAPRFGARPSQTPLARQLDLESNRAEIQVVELARQLLRPGGRGVVVVPEGLLFAANRAHVELRRRLVEEAGLRAVISLPGGVFRPFTSVSTAILVFDASPARTVQVLFFQVGSVASGAAGVASEEDLALLPGLLALPVEGTPEQVPAALREQAWTVTGAQIFANDFDLAPQTYRPVPPGDADHPDPVALFEEVMRLEERFGERLTALEGLLDAGP